jgi:2-phosphosulfolactate phosphatase
MIDVALCPSEIRRFSVMDLSGVTAVVFDVLRATSSMITGLGAGALEIFPVNSVDEARRRKLKEPDLLLAGERGGLPPDGFDLGNSPEEFEKTTGRKVVMTTTNGTVAIQSMRRASEVLIGALLNMDALAEHLARRQPKNLLLVCAGTQEEFSLEDAVAAGALIARLPGGDQLSDSAILVRALSERTGDDLEGWLQQTKNGRALQKIGKGSDIERCARLSTSETIGCFQKDAVIRLRIPAVGPIVGRIPGGRQSPGAAEKLAMHAGPREGQPAILIT